MRRHTWCLIGDRNSLLVLDCRSFSYINISQGCAVTRVRCGEDEIFKNIFIIICTYIVFTTFPLTINIAQKREVK